MKMAWSKTVFAAFIVLCLVAMPALSRNNQAPAGFDSSRALAASAPTPDFYDPLDGGILTDSTLTSAQFNSAIDSLRGVSEAQIALIGQAVHLDGLDSYIGYPGRLLNPTEGSIRFAWSPDSDLYEVYRNYQSSWRDYNGNQNYGGFLLDTVGWAAANTGAFTSFLSFVPASSGAANTTLTFSSWNGSNWASAQKAGINWKPGQWYDVAFTWSAGDKLICTYLDGKKIAEGSYNGPLNADEPFFLGQAPWSFNGEEYWPYGPHAMLGSYDELRIYKQALHEGDFGTTAPTPSPTPSPSPSATPTPRPTPTGKAGPIDLVFCIDTTGSMGEDIQQVKDQAAMIINTLAGMTGDFRVGLIGYRDFGSNPPDAYTFVDFPFTSDFNKIIENINALQADGGGDDPEAIYEALLCAMDNVTLGRWRNGAGKIIILMGDAPPHEKGETSQDGSYTYQYTVSDVATVAQNLDPAHIFPVITGTAEDVTTEAFKQIATLTGGQVFTADEASKVPQVISSVISTAVTEVSRVYPDISGHWAATEIEKLTKIGILRGFPDGLFKPDQPVTRAQFAKIMTIALRIPEVKPASPTFSDVPTNHWAYGYIEAAAKRGLLKGFPDGTFKPEDPVSKAQAAAIIARENGWTATPASPSFNDIATTNWAFAYIEGDLQRGILRISDPNINASGNTFGDVASTRAQACVLVYRMLEITATAP